MAFCAQMSRRRSSRRSAEQGRQTATVEWQAAKCRVDQEDREDWREEVAVAVAAASLPSFLEEEVEVEGEVCRRSPCAVVAVAAAVVDRCRCTSCQASEQGQEVAVAAVEAALNPWNQVAAVVAVEEDLEKYS